MFKSNCDSDNYETPISVWRQLLPFLKDYKTVVDPFYCNGRAKIYWEDLGKKCINQDIDAYSFPKSLAPGYCIVTNPPFSDLQKAITFLADIIGDVFILLPISVLNSTWFQDLLTSTKADKDFDILPITLRSGFIKDGIQLRTSPIACCFISFVSRNVKRVR